MDVSSEDTASTLVMGQHYEFVYCDTTQKRYTKEQVISLGLSTYVKNGLTYADFSKCDIDEGVLMRNDLHKGIINVSF